VATVAEPRSVRATLPLRWRKGFAGDLWAEFFGCFILISFGDGVVAMLGALVNSGRSTQGALNSSGDWLLVTWGWCLAVAFAVYTVGGLTGGHINPAITLGQAVRGNFPWKRVLPYWLFQFLGCFVGAALVFLLYNNSINHSNEMAHIVKGSYASKSTFGIFATWPAPYFSNVLGPLVDQIVGTFFLALFVFAVTDEFNLPVGSNMTPWIVGFIVMAIGVSFGANAGYAINPARDFGPRIFAWIAGWGKEAMPGNYLVFGGVIKNYFWVPIVGPLLGGAIAAVVYDLGIRDFLRARMGPEPGIHGVGEVVRDVRPPAPDR